MSAMERMGQPGAVEEAHASEHERVALEYIEVRERERGGAFDFHVSIPKMFSEDGSADLEGMRRIVAIIRSELGGKIKAKHFVSVKNYNDPRTGHDPSAPGLMLTQVLPNYPTSIERVGALLHLLQQQDLQDVSFEIENIMPAAKQKHGEKADGDIDPQIAFEQLGATVEKAEHAPTHETHYGWKGRVGEVPDFDWIRDNVQRVCNRPIHQIVDFGNLSGEEIDGELRAIVPELRELIASVEREIRPEAKSVTVQLSETLDAALAVKDLYKLAGAIVGALKELELMQDNLADTPVEALQSGTDALYSRIPKITRVATTYEDNRDAVRETAKNLRRSRAELRWSWAEPEQVVAVGHLKE